MTVFDVINKTKSFLFKVEGKDVAYRYLKNVDAERLRRHLDLSVEKFMLYNIIDYSFIWERTEEGDGYWRNLYDRYDRDSKTLTIKPQLKQSYIT